MKSAARRRLALVVIGTAGLLALPAWAQEAEATDAQAKAAVQNRLAEITPPQPETGGAGWDVLDVVYERLVEETIPLQAAVMAEPQAVAAPEPTGLQPLLDAVVGLTRAMPAGAPVTPANEVNRTGEGLAPQPAIVPRDWEFEFKSGPIRTISVPDVVGRPQVYWFLPYQVTNNSGQERPFVPEVTLVTDQGDALDAGARVPPGVFEAIQQKLGNRLLENPNQVTGRLLQGRDFARESVAIWPAPRHNVSYVRVFVAGLSGETARVNVPGGEQTAVLRKTLLLHFDTPGNPASAAAVRFVPGPTRWVMR